MPLQSLSQLNIQILVINVNLLVKPNFKQIIGFVNFKTFFQFNRARNHVSDYK